VTSLCAFPTAFRQLVFQLKEGLVPSVETNRHVRHKVLPKTCTKEHCKASHCHWSSTRSSTTPPVNFWVPGEVGEIIFRSPHVMRGYHNRPDATAQVLDEQGWCSSGDAGYYDSYGNLYIVERIKDMIKCMDQQVAPAEIETILNQHPLVREAAVVGIDHPELGEAPTAFVVVEPSARGQVSEEELVQLVCSFSLTPLHTILLVFIAEQMVFYKNLHGGVIFVDHIPTTDTGKYQRNKLRQEHSCHLKKQCSNT
ncbi:hypothetical protein MRX96_057509, partial [Rhipicephalus microplus]